MARSRIFGAAVAIGCFAIAQSAIAQLDDHLWVGPTGNQQWQVDANWQLNALPTTFPNDPGRIDAVPATIVNSEGANLSVNLGANLNVDVGATNVTVASLTMGSTSGAVATNITSSGGKLVFENFEDNNTTPEPDVCAFNCGVGMITSQGVPGATNTISAIVALNDQVDITGAKPITLAGGLEEMGGEGNTGSAVGIRALVGSTVFVTGNITTIDIPVGINTEDVGLGLNASPASQGTIDVSGVISGPGRMRIGTDAQAPLLPLGTVILRANNTYAGRTVFGRGNTVLAHNNALGTGDIKQEGDAGGGFQTGYNIISDNDSRTIANDFVLAHWQTVKGEHSIKFSGQAYQTNTRGWINMLPAGKTLTLTGQQYTFELFDGEEERILTFDGSGKTIVTGGIRNRWDADQEVEVVNAFEGSIRIRGTGVLEVNGDNLLPNSDSNFNANIYVEGGNLHFATNADFGSAARVVSEFGAVGVDDGVVNNVLFLSLLNNASNPALDEADIANVFDHGGLMLASGEYGMNLDFTGAHASAANMSLAAHETGNSYTGTITPANNTYRFGGGSGALTLPNLNQMTGARNVAVSNGGEVRITGTNNYTGTTSIIAEFVSSVERAAAEDTIGFNDGDTIPNNQVYRGTTLTATTLANGGTPSSIGSSSNAASNLYIQGSTLKYVGGATSTNRLFTIGTGGATIDASGTGAVSFANAAALAVDVAEARTGNVNRFATGAGEDATQIRNIPSTEDLQVGMSITSPGLPTSGSSAGILPGTTILRIEGPHDVIISQPIGEFAFYNDTPISFGAAPERKLTLTGTNSASNTLASLVQNASDGGVVGVTKTGVGKWVLTGTNTYSGATTVNGGTLQINGNQTGIGLTTVNSGGTLGGTGSIGGGLTVNSGGHVAPGASIGTFTVAGGLTLAAGSILDFELGAPGTSDRLNVNLAGGTTVNGGILNLINAGGLTAGAYTLIDYAGALVGNVDNIVFGTIPSGFSFDLVDTGSAINLNVLAAATNDADFNNDGIIDAADYVVWRKFTPLTGTGSQQTGDANGDTNVNGTDYNIWKSTFGNASPGAGGGSGTVPEPTSLMLAGLALLGAVGRSRRTR